MNMVNSGRTLRLAFQATAGDRPSYIAVKRTGRSLRVTVHTRVPQVEGRRFAAAKTYCVDLPLRGRDRSIKRVVDGPTLRRVYDPARIKTPCASVEVRY